MFKDTYGDKYPMASEDERIIGHVGGSHYVSLPPGWLAFNRLGKGSPVKVIADGVLIIVPKGKEARTRRLLALLEEA